MVKSALKLLLLSGLLYLVFLVRLDERTLFEHLRRIAASDEAQDLKAEMNSAVDSSGERVKEGLLEPAEKILERAGEAQELLP